LTVVDDFVDFGKDELDQALCNIRTAIPGIPAIAEIVDNDGNIIQEAISAIPDTLHIIMPAKSAQCLMVSSIAWYYYTNTSQSVTNVNMHYNNVLKNFHIEWKAISLMAEAPSPDVPCITKTNPPLHWTDTFCDYCLNTFGVRKTPLAYVICDNVQVAQHKMMMT
jgi:hypothetical protein